MQTYYVKFKMYVWSLGTVTPSSVHEPNDLLALAACISIGCVFSAKDTRDGVSVLVVMEKSGRVDAVKMSNGRKGTKVKEFWRGPGSERVVIVGKGVQPSQRSVLAVASLRDGGALI